MSIVLERGDNNPPLLQETEPEASFGNLSNINLKELADKTNGRYANNGIELILWGGEDGIFNSRLTKEVNSKTKKIVYRMATETFRDEVSDYVFVIQGEMRALIDAIDPSRNVITGFEIKDGRVDAIMGHESKFPNAYSKARDMAYQAKLETLQTH